jgi:alkylation response protein AidB-like acyl-CoA dehydrogenase
VQQFGPDLEEHQQLLMAAADILIEVYMAESAVLRAEKNARRSGEDSQKTQIAMAQLYLYDAVDIVMRKAKEAIISFAEGDEQRMMLMGLKRFTKYQNHPNVVQLKEMIADAVAENNGYTFD